MERGYVEKELEAPRWAQRAPSPLQAGLPGGCSVDRQLRSFCYPKAASDVQNRRTF